MLILVSMGVFGMDKVNMMTLSLTIFFMSHAAEMEHKGKEGRNMDHSPVIIERNVFTFKTFNRLKTVTILNTIPGPSYVWQIYISCMPKRLTKQKDPTVKIKRSYSNTST